jgi:hypothetical protein
VGELLLFIHLELYLPATGLGDAYLYYLLLNLKPIFPFEPKAFEDFEFPH